MYLPIPQNAVRSVEQLMRYIDQPVNFYETIVSNVHNV